MRLSAGSPNPSVFAQTHRKSSCNATVVVPDTTDAEYRENDPIEWICGQDRDRDAPLRA